MATIKGKWVFSETPNIDDIVLQFSNMSNYWYPFTSDNAHSDGIHIEYNSVYKTFGIYYWFDVTHEDTTRVYTSDKGWVNENYRTVDFGETENTVLDDFYAWMQANAEEQVEEESKVVNIEYNGSIIATVESGKTATLHCADKKMSTDILVTAPEIQEVKLQEKTITENCEAIPDEGYSGFSKVTVNVPIPEGYIDPEGTKEITENGIHDITEFESVTINVPIPTFEVYDGSVTISGGVELISFTINGDHYEAEAGMTWYEWCASNYNTYGYSTLNESGSYVLKDKGAQTEYVCKSASGGFNNCVVGIDVIDADTVYYHYIYAGGSGN